MGFFCFNLFFAFMYLNLYEKIWFGSCIVQLTKQLKLLDGDTYPVLGSRERCFVIDFELETFSQYASFQQQQQKNPQDLLVEFSFYY